MNVKSRNAKEAHHKVGRGETPRRSIGKRCRFSSLDKFEYAFDIAVDLMQTKPSDAAFSDVFFELADDVISDMAVQFRSE